MATDKCHQLNPQLFTVKEEASSFASDEDLIFLCTYSCCWVRHCWDSCSLKALSSSSLSLAPWMGILRVNLDSEGKERHRIKRRSLASAEVTCLLRRMELTHHFPVQTHADEVFGGLSLTPYIQQDFFTKTHIDGGDFHQRWGQCIV